MRSKDGSTRMKESWTIGSSIGRVPMKPRPKVVPIRVRSVVYGVLLLFLLLAGLILGAALFYKTEESIELREQIVLLKQINEQQFVWCQGIVDVNDVCSETLIDLLNRLGLESTIKPLLITAIEKRAKKSYGPKVCDELEGSLVSQGLMMKKSTEGIGGQ